MPPASRFKARLDLQDLECRSVPAGSPFTTGNQTLAAAVQQTAPAPAPLPVAVKAAAAATATTPKVGVVIETVRKNWGDGATIDITVRNTKGTNMSGWRVEFDAPFAITDWWNARLVSQTGNHYVFRNIPGYWNAVIAPGASIKFGFNAQFDPGTPTYFQNVTLNGQTPDAGGNKGGSATGTVTQKVRSYWGTGATNDVTIKNTGTTKMKGWTVEFDAPFAVTDVWNANLVSHVGDHYVFQNYPGFFNASIPANKTVAFGFNVALDTGMDVGIANFKLNGVDVGNPGNPGGGGNPGGTTTGTVTQALRSNWGTGATSDMTIKNTGTATMNGWTVEFDAPFVVTGVWNAQLVGQTGDHYVFRNIPGYWNATIRPNASITFGFNSQFDLGTDPYVTNIKLNGVLVNPGGNPNGGGGTGPISATVTPVIRAQWADGTTNDVTILNTGTTAIDGWTVTFDAAFEITTVWNAQLVSHVGTKYTISNIPGFWNTRIAPGTGVTFGFNTHFDAGDSLAITNLTLNGKPV